MRNNFLIDFFGDVIMDIIFIRHGETKDNIKKIYSRKEASLSIKGQEEILTIKGKLNNKSFGKVYVSPLKRTKETLELLELEGIEDFRIEEYDFGIFAGKSYEEVTEIYPKETKLWIEDYINYKIPKGESFKEFYLRVIDFLEGIIESGEENILVITHEGVIKAALCWVFDNIEYFYKFKVNNGSIVTISVNDGYKYIKMSQ